MASTLRGLKLKWNRIDTGQWAGLFPIGDNFPVLFRSGITRDEYIFEIPRKGPQLKLIGTRFIRVSPDKVYIIRAHSTHNAKLTSEKLLGLWGRQTRELAEVLSKFDSAL